MQKKTLITAVAALGLSAMLAIGGCSKKEETQPATQQAQPAQGMQQNATLIADLEARYKQDPKNPEVLWRLGDAYFDSKQFNESVKYYKKVLEVKPGEADLYNDLGLSLHYLGNSAEAVKYLDEGIKKNPYHQRIWLTKGFILAYGMGDIEGAKVAWEKANALNPESQIGKAAAEYLTLVNKK
ncbi:MAG: tetratricopeptide repeat protein [Deltaproteobacteria bacterium]|nr:tetratricopeptide repeat protein [Deltaproteobacteria bacterium]